jgi:hypothetical protein
MMLKFYSTRKPTIFNKNMVDGALISAPHFFAIFFAASNPCLLIMPLAALAITLLGGIIGKCFMHMEQKHGINIDRPSIFNRYNFTGAWAGGALTAALLVSNIVFHHGFHPSNATILSTMQSIRTGIVASLAILMPAGWILGGLYGIPKAQAEYDQAFRQRYMVQDGAPSQEVEQEHAPSIETHAQHVENLKKRDAAKDETDRGDSRNLR